MVSINTNLSSYLVRQQLSKSTYSLNKAIERMTTGFKVNHASDNAANYSIIQNMNKDISAYDVAAENVAMGSDFSATAQDSLTLVSTHMERIRDLLSQASNGTYGEQSRKAIQSEIDARLSEVNRIFQSTEYNGVQIFNSAILPSTLNINIADLNLKAGSFDVNVDGVNYTINLAKEDSLYSIISKLQAIGVEADFNEESGVFTVELDASKITDNGTGFVDVLALGNTDGYIAENLHTNEVYTVLESANANSTLSSVGVTDGSFTIIDSEGNETTGVISVDASISELFNQLWTYQISGNIDSNGVVTFTSTTGNRISGALAEQLGINVDVIETEYQGLTLDTTKTLTHSFVSNATADTTLDKLGVVAGESLIVKDNEGNDLYTFTADNESIQNITLGGLFNNLVDAGYLTNANVNNGVVSISSDINNYVTGSIASRFGISLIENDAPVTAGITQTSSNAITYNEIVNANSNMKLAELGITSGDTFNVKDNSGTNIYTFTADDISIQNITIGDFLNDLVSEGYLSSANITDGVISLSSDVNNYVTGSIADKFGIGIETNTAYETVLYNQTSSEPISYVQTLVADNTSTLQKLGIEEGDTLIVKDNFGEDLYTFTADADNIQNTTIQGVLDDIIMSGYLTSGNITNGIISVSSDDYNYLTGSIASKLGISVNTETLTNTTVSDITSSGAITYKETALLSGDTKLYDLGVEDGDYLYVKDQDGIIVALYTAYESELNNTLNNMFNSISESANISLSVSEGKISVSSDEYYYLSGPLADRLGIQTEQQYINLTTAVSATSSEPVTYTKNGLIENGISLGSTGIEAGDNLHVRNNAGEIIYTYTVTEEDLTNETVDGVFDFFKRNGFISSFSLSDGVISISSEDNNYLTGEIADKYNIGVTTTNRYETQAIELTSASPVEYIATINADNTSTFSQISVDTDGAINVYDESGNFKGSFTVGSSSTLSDLVNSINSANTDANAYINNGRLEMSGYITGDVADRMEINVIDEDGIKSASSKVLTYTTPQTLSYYTTFSDLGLTDVSITMNDDTVISFNTNDSIAMSFASAGLVSNVNDGKITINGGIDNYIKSMSPELANALKIQTGDGYSYEAKNNTYHFNTNSSPISSNGTYRLTTSSTLHDITGLSSASFTLDNGTVVSLNSSDSIYEKLNSYLQVSIDNGEMTISGYRGRSLIDMTPELANALKVQVGEGYSYNVSNPLYYVNPTTEAKTVDNTHTITTSTTLGELGLSDASFTMNNDTVINISSSDSIYSKLTGAGLEVQLENGILSITADDGNYIKSMNSELAEKLNIQIGDGYNYEITNTEIHTNTPSETQKVYNTFNLSYTTTLDDLGLNEASFKMEDDSVITLNKNDSIYNKLTTAGVNVEIDNGAITISPNEGHYLKDMSANLKAALKLQVGEGNTYTVNEYNLHTNTNSETINVTNTHTLSTETTLQDLGMSSGSFTMNDDTVVNLNSSDSIYAKMQDAGLDVRVGIDGKLSIVGDNDNYIKSMSSNLAEALKIQTGEGKTYEVTHNITRSNSASNTQTYLSTATLTSANSSTYRLSDWGLQTNSKIYTNNKVIDVSRTDTIATLISKLNQAGIGATVNDENGTLEIVNRDNAYITSADAAIKNMLGFEAGEGKTYNSTTVTHRSDTTSKILQESIKHTIAHAATENTLLKDFNTDELNIQGDLVFDMADGQKVIKITSDDTISSLIEKLKDIGIKAIFKNQALSISGNKNNVLLLDNSSSTTSFLADLLGLEHTDKLEDLSCTSDLNALADSIYADKFNTPEFLCIQAGITGNDRDMIKMDMRLSLGRVTFNAADTKSASKGLDKIDELISKISAKQTEYGAFSNRMESAADSITIALQNLVSSKSTLQDADIAVESSNYIKAQILQQAAATLLATANQTPAIAIQLL